MAFAVLTTSCGAVQEQAAPGLDRCWPAGQADGEGEEERDTLAEGEGDRESDAVEDTDSDAVGVREGDADADNEMD